MQITVVISGDEKVRALLKHTSDGMVDLTKPLREASDYLVRYFSGVAFASRGGVYGSRWPALNQAYERRKLKKYGSRPMLIASGRMQASYQSAVSPHRAIISNNVRGRNGFNYFEAHQTGTRFMPRRMTMGVNNTNEREVNDIINDYVRKEIGKAA